MTEEAQMRGFYLVFDSDKDGGRLRLNVAAEFLGFQDQDSVPCDIHDTGAAWEEHSIKGLCRLGPFAKYGERHVETQASFDAGLRAKDAEIVRARDRYHADLLKANNATQVVRNRVGELGAELEDVRGERDIALKAVEALTPVLENAEKMKEDLEAKQQEAAGLRRTIDEDRANHAAACRNLEGQVEAARAGR